MVMETPEGEWAVEPFRPNSILYVPRVGLIARSTPA